MPSIQAKSVGKPLKLPLVVAPATRDETGGKDAKLINGYAERDSVTGDVQIYQRFGWGGALYNIPPAAGRGMFQWVGKVSVTYNNYSVPTPPFTGNMVAQFNNTHVSLGFWSGAGPFGSLSVTSAGGLPAANSVIEITDNTVSNQAGLTISGFSADPGSAFFTAITVGGVTYLSSAATYTYSAGEASWIWSTPYGLAPGYGFAVQITFPDQVIKVPVYTSDPVLAVITGTNMSFVSQGGSPSTTTVAIPGSTGGGINRFLQIPAATPLLMFSDGTTGAFYTDGATITKITDVNYPTTPVPGLQILDGTIYVMDVDANIWNSTNLNDPTTWSSTGVIKAAIEGDLGVYLAKQLNYLIALKQWTTQFFYDAGNAPPGSPLGELEGSMLNYGCLSAQTVQDIDDLLAWVSSDKLGTPQVMLMENLSAGVISTPPIERLLATATPNTPFTSHMIHASGHRQYVLTRLDTGYTMVYDLDQKLWSYYFTGMSMAIWPFMASAYDLYGNRLVQALSNGLVYPLSDCFVYPSDNGVQSPLDIYTPNFDAGVTRRKQLNQMYFDTDLQTGGKLLVRFSDDDYNSWSNFTQVDLGVERPRSKPQGTFWRRAWHFRYLGSKGIRIRSVNLPLDIGTI